MKTEIKAEEIYNYFMDYMNIENKPSEKVKKEMLKEVCFMLETD